MFSLSLPLLSTVSPAENPTYYDFHPQSVMSLGRGFSVEDLTKAKQSCVDFEPVPLDLGSLGTVATVQLVKNSSELKTALGMDMNVDVSALVYKASANLSYSQDSLFRQEDATLVIRFATEYARTGMKKQKLSPEAQALLDAGDLPAFEEMCGSQMVIIERRGSSVSAIVTFRNIESETKSKY